MTNETIADILYEMRLNHDGIDVARRAGLGYFADRIEAAAKRENDRLRAALKPVIDVNIDGMDSYCRVNCESLLKSIVREAQRIYKEGDNND